MLSGCDKTEVVVIKLSGCDKTEVVVIKLSGCDKTEFLLIFPLNTEQSAKNIHIRMSDSRGFSRWNFPPAEVMVNVFCLLTAEDLSECTVVCKGWRNILKGV